MTLLLSNRSSDEQTIAVHHYGYAYVKVRYDPIGKHFDKCSNIAHWKHM